MKFIISENRIDEHILNYINSKYDVDNINWTNYVDDNGNETDSAVLFYYGDFNDDETVFRWYNKDYWEEDIKYYEDDKNINYINSLIDKSPILMFESENDYNSFEGLFSHLWKPVFINWFEENFGLPVKTIET